MDHEIKNRIAVLGAGTMGNGIAQVSALGGYQVLLYDLERSFIEKGLAKIRENLSKGVEKGKIARVDMEAAFDRLLGTTDLEHAVSNVSLVIEAAPEKLELKRELFAKLAKFCKAQTILASNTSSLSISQIAAATNCPDRVLGLHFFNPVHLMKLLEVVRGEKTSDATLQLALEFAQRIGKNPITVKDSPGFASSRLGVALGLEAIRMFEAGVASAQDIDTAMELGYNHPMGPLKLTDVVGLDVRLAIAEYLEKTVGPQFKAPELMKRMVHEGKLGKKTGQGFYNWNAP